MHARWETPRGVIPRRTGRRRGESETGRHDGGLDIGALVRSSASLITAAPRAFVCLPTYNEAENVEQMVRALGGVLDVARDLVLVIDDASPDGTGEIAERLAASLPWMSVLQRPRKAGLGPAYVAGFQRALDEGAEFIVTMDCDFSHDHADVPRLIDAAADADLVLGSRYIQGGANDSPSLVRRAASRGGCLYAQTLLGVRIADLTGGFKCIRRSALEQIDLTNLYLHGHEMHIELTYRALLAGLRVREIPIRFLERRAGTSKMTALIAAEATWKVPALRLRSFAGRLSSNR